jgi:hypothetical protein
VVFKAQQQTLPQFHCKTVHVLRELISSQKDVAALALAICTMYALMFSVFACIQVMKVIVGFKDRYVVSPAWKKQFKLQQNGLSTGISHGLQSWHPLAWPTPQIP